MNNGWDLGVWWAKSFLCRGPKVWPQAVCLGRSNRLSLAVAIKAATVLHQYSAGLEGSHRTQACTAHRADIQAAKNSEKRERKERGGRRAKEEGITCPTNSPFRSLFRWLNCKGPKINTEADIRLVPASL